MQLRDPEAYRDDLADEAALQGSGSSSREDSDHYMVVSENWGYLILGSLL